MIESGVDGMAHYVSASAPHNFGRLFALAGIGLLALSWSVVLFATWSAPHALFGWNIGPDGTTLIYITPGGPAENAGLRPGDRVDWSKLPLAGRANLAIVEAVSPSTKLAVTYERGAVRRTVVVAPRRWPPIFEIASRTVTLGGLFLVGVGIALVQLRPSRMTWAFLLSSLLWAYPTYISWHWAQSAPANFAIADGVLSLLRGAYAAGILIFMSRFPSDRPRGPLVVLDRIAIPLGIAVTVFGLLIDAAILFSSHPPPAWALFLNQSLIQVLLFALALGALSTAYVLTKSSDRQRIVPVLIAFAFSVACTVAHNIYSAFFTNPFVTAGQYLLLALSMAALAIAVANGVVRHRVLDVSFAISRTVVYTVLTSIVVGVLVLIDFISSKLLERLQIAMLLEVCAALAFGVWLNVLHSRIDRFVDRVLFRRRHAAQARLERTARTLVHAESAAFVDEALVVEACDALSLASAAVFRRDGGAQFVRVFSSGWETRHLDRLTTDDALTVVLLAELQPVDLSEIRARDGTMPAGTAQPIFVVPLIVRHELLGAVLYGGHVGGEAIDPDEKRVLAQLAGAAAVAYEHVRVRAIVSESNALREQNVLLEKERTLLREMVDALRSVSGRVES